MIEHRFILTWPPSVNEYFSTIRRPGHPLAGRVLRSSAVDRYWNQAAVEMIRQRVPRDSLAGELELELVFRPPERKRDGSLNRGRYDLSNHVKAVEDALVKHGVIEDDAMITRLVASKGTRLIVPRVEVCVRQLVAAAKQEAMGL